MSKPDTAPARTLRVCDAVVAFEQNRCAECGGMRRPCRHDAAVGDLYPTTAQDRAAAWPDTRQQLAQSGFPFSAIAPVTTPATEDIR